MVKRKICTGEGGVVKGANDVRDGSRNEAYVCAYSIIIIISLLLPLCLSPMQV